MAKEIIYEEIDSAKETAIMQFYSDFTYRCPHWPENDYSDWRVDYDAKAIYFRHRYNYGWKVMSRTDDKLYQRLARFHQDMQFEKAVLDDGS